MNLQKTQESNSINNVNALAWGVLCVQRMKMPLRLRLFAPGILAVSIVVAGCSQPTLFRLERGQPLAAIPSDAEVPNGMRRTNDGWEDASNWNIRTDLKEQSIDSWILEQREQEPGWLRRVFDKLRTTPPLMIAVIQITAIAAIVQIGRYASTDPNAAKL